MKKLILSFIALISFFSLSQGFEAHIKVGYDFFRGITVLYKELHHPFKKYEKGFVIGLELLPLTFQNEKSKLGAVVEYNFGTTDVKYKNVRWGLLSTMVPLYATTKFTYYRHSCQFMRLV